MRPRVHVLLYLGLFGFVLCGGGVGGRGGSSALVPQLEGALVQLLQRGAEAPLWAQEHAVSLDPREKMVRVVIEPRGGRPSGHLLDEIRALGGRIEAQSGRLLRARLPLRRLGEAARLSEVAFIRRPYTMKPLVSIRYSTGTLPTGALLFHSLGFHGQGVRVAIIDAGFKGLSEALLRGWITPAALFETIDYTGEGLEEGSDHGTQVARIVHEMAPKAQLILMKISDEVDLENAAQDAVRLGARVINHSLGWFDTNFGDGTGVIDEIVRRAAEAGVLWVNAAGNQARRHWIGRFFDRDGDGWAEFGLGQEELLVWAGFGGVIELVLVWDDWPQTDQDFDLFLLNGRDEVVASSETPQRGGDPPRELLDYVVEEPGVYKLRVRARRVHPNRPLNLRIFSLDHDLTPAVPHGSIVAPADCECALAVGAIGLRGWDRGLIEGFSARGPTSDGRIKPDLVAPDGVRGFFGTSAAAPYAAGAAALLLSRHPEWDLPQLWEALLSSALDLGPPGKDVESGAGKLQLSLGEPRAVRSLSSTDIPAGGELIVKISVRMPPARFGALTLTERLPEGTHIEPVDDGGADFIKLSDREARWVWPLLGPDDEREITYRLRISETIKPGRYRLEGTINDRPIKGEEWLEILPLSGGRRPLSLAISVHQGGISFRLQSSSLSEVADWGVRIFDLSGRLRFDRSSIRGSRLDVAALSWANGVYLALITVRDASGHRQREIRRLVILR